MALKSSLSSKSGNKRWLKLLGLLVGLFLLVDFLLGWYWSQEPDLFPVTVAQQSVPGEVTTSTLIQVVETLLNKPGGYLSNDIMPHRLWLDNMPNWEYGVLVQVRDLSRSMRREMSRSQSQSKEDPNLSMAEPRFNFNSTSWMLPSSEGQYRKGLKELKAYRKRLKLPSSDNNHAQFYARADNLDAWLGDVQNRLGSLSQALASSVAREMLTDELPNELLANASTDDIVKTPRFKVDNIFYEARGACWAIVELMRAVEVDFSGVLAKKNATPSYLQVLRELESTQKTLWSPIVLNGSGFGIFANHSLVMANYVSRANSAIIELRQLLQRG